MAVTSLEIQERRPLANGSSFGESGPFESIKGIMHFAIAPDDRDARLIADIQRAERGAEGLVHCSSDFHILKPIQPQAGGKLLFDVINRGRKLVLNAFNNAPRGPETDQANDVGDGFLLRHGFTILWCGWQHDIPNGPGQMRINLPDALDDDGKPLIGPASVQYQLNARVSSMPLCDRGHTPLPTADLEDPLAVLTIRDNPESEPTVIDRGKWRFGRLDGGAYFPDPKFLTIDGGFTPGAVYEIVYNSIGAPVIGLGFLAVRDSTAFLKYASAEEGNPCAGSISYAYAYGASQTGRYLREMLYLGLNADSQGRRVFDGVQIHTGSSRRGEFNLRFGQPSTNILRAPGNVFPFTYDSQTDPDTGDRDGLLDRVVAANCVPKIVATNSDMEYWWSGGSLAHTDVAATRDVEPPANVRHYLLSCAQHGTGSLPLVSKTEDGIPASYPLNTIDYRPLLRAALMNLDRWVREGAEPPPSQFPRLADGTAVRRDTLASAFTRIPGLGFPSYIPLRRRLDFGPDAERGIVQLPPTEGMGYATFASTVDEDSNDRAGVRPLDVRVPLATYMGWNLRHPDVGGVGQFYFGNPLIGSTIPFPRTESERSQSGDPRRSIEERYGTREGFLSQVRETAKAMINEGWLLEEDFDLAVRQASDRYDAITAEAAPRVAALAKPATA